MPQKYTWTDYEWKQIKLGQLLGIIIPFNNFARKIYISRNLWEPVRNIMEIDLRGGQLEGSSIPKYLIQSLHCHNVANVLVAIAPKYKLDNVPYAATFTWEVYTLNG
jgi:hypothetical protein